VWESRTCNYAAGDQQCLRLLECHYSLALQTGISYKLLFPFSSHFLSTIPIPIPMNSVYASMGPMGIPALCTPLEQSCNMTEESRLDEFVLGDWCHVVCSWVRWNTVCWRDQMMTMKCQWWWKLGSTVMATAWRQIPMFVQYKAFLNISANVYLVFAGSCTVMFSCCENDIL